MNFQVFLSHVDLIFTCIYADDVLLCSIIGANPTAFFHVQNDISKIVQWSFDNSLTLNQSFLYEHLCRAMDTHIAKYANIKCTLLTTTYT